MKTKIKGISLISLIITIAVVIIIAGVAMQNGMQRTDNAKLAEHNTNISTIQEEVENYYHFKGGELPVTNLTPYPIPAGTALESEIIKNGEQADKFYILDLSKIGKVAGKEGTGLGDDFYIVSATRHNVYYIKGTTIKGYTYHGMITKNDVRLAQITGEAIITDGLTATPTPGGPGSIVNAPKLAAGMTAIKFGGPTTTTQAKEDFEDDTYPFTVSGSWLRTTTKAYQGSYSFVNNDVAVGKTTGLTITTTASPSAGETAALKFYYFTDTRTDVECLDVYVNGSRLYRGSGQQSKWTYTAIPLVNGSNTIEFRYNKILSDTSNVYIDNVEVLTITDSNEYQVADSSNIGHDWFDYTKGVNKWANVMLNDGSMLVWIPRYTYKITSGYHTDTAGTIEVKFSNGINDDTGDGYIKNPAFTFGGTELMGIWIAKFETSNDGTGKIQVKPGKLSWVGPSINQIFNACRYMETTNYAKYGFLPDNSDTNNIDTHLIKNCEWGATAYLTYWTTQNQPIMNGTLRAGGGANGIYKVSTSQSTTNNIYGVYDMSGGVDEYVCAYLNCAKAGTDSDDVAVNADAKYKDILTSYGGSGSLDGMATYETSSQSGGGWNDSWLGNLSSFPYNTVPWLTRGCYYLDCRAGMFAFGEHGGGGSSSFNVGFRVGMVVLE